MATIENGAVRLSPLHSIHQSAGTTLTTLQNWQVATVVKPVTDALPNVALADLSDRAKVIVEGPGAGALLQGVLGVATPAVNRGIDIPDAGLAVYSLRPDRYYLRAATGGEQELIAKLTGAAEQVSDLVTVTDETDGRSELLLMGAGAATCLSRVCGLDFHADEFPNHTAKQTSVAKIRQLIIRSDQNDMPAYVVSGGRSYAIYLWETLLQAGSDLGIRAIGQEVVNSR